jgi:hypothetical protein
MEQQEEVKSTLKELAEVRAQMHSKVSNKPKDEETEVVAEVKEEPVEQVETLVSGHKTETVEEESLIRIGDKEFKSTEEAIKYAESLEHDKLIAEAYNQGIRDTMTVAKPAVAPEPEPEDNFEERFYTDPKGTLKEIEEKATKKALEAIQGEQKKEQLWSQFFNENPDLANQRSICEHVLQQNWETIGQMTDIPKAMKLLATKTRSIFQDYIEKSKPRVELPAKKGQVVSSGGSAGPGVTPTKRVDEPSDFVSQLKKVRR